MLVCHWDRYKYNNDHSRGGPWDHHPITITLITGGWDSGAILSSGPRASRLSPRHSQHYCWVDVGMPETDDQPVWPSQHQTVCKVGNTQSLLASSRCPRTGTLRHHEVKLLVLLKMIRIISHQPTTWTCFTAICYQNYTFGSNDDLKQVITAKTKASWITNVSSMLVIPQSPKTSSVYIYTYLLHFFFIEI